MRLLITFNDNDKVISTDVSAEMPVRDLKAYIEVESGSPSQSLVLVHKSKPMLELDEPLTKWGVEEDDMIIVFEENNISEGHASSEDANASSSVPAEMAELWAQVEKVRQQMLRDTVLRDGVKQRYPELVDVVNEPVKFRELMISIEKKRVADDEARKRELKRLQDDPYNEESQRKILELIQQEAVMDNLNTALEHSPEVFGNVTMLFVNVLVNGKLIKAFVDSGAQATVISPDCVEACNLTHLIDRRFQGVARGVGTAKIIGRIHSAPMKVGNSFLPCSFTVMEGKSVDLLLGLDMLKRHQASIDLKRNVLVFGDGEVPFLPESEIPSSYLETFGQPVEEAQDPSSSGGAGSSTSRAIINAQPPPNQASNYPEETIQTLVNLGFTEEQSIQALNSAGGNPELAAALLFQ